MRFPGERQAVIDGLTERGIGTLIYYPIPIHRQAYLQAYLPGAADLDLPVTNRLSDEVLAIPVHPMLSSRISTRSWRPCAPSRRPVTR